MSPGRLVLVPTPIGNLEDVTLRALDALRGADLIAAEDTRRTRKLLSRFDIHAKTVSYHEHNERAQGTFLLARMRGGDTVALVSDAGTPGIADPGERLVAACLAEGIPVQALPGPSAVVTALVQSGLPTSRFCFLGWVPRRGAERDELVARLATSHETVVLYESPKRLAATLARLAKELAGRPAAVARELTKVHEEVLRGTVAELAEAVERATAAGPLKGEVILVVGPAAAASARGAPERADLEAVAARESEGDTTREAVRTVAAERGLSRRALYEAVLAARRSGTL